MSPVIMVRKGTPSRMGRDRPDEGEGPSGKDWMWLGLAAFSTCLVALGLRLVLSTHPAPPTPHVETTRPPEPVPVVQPESSAFDSPPGSVRLMHDEAVQATVQSLREHAQENPEAPDALTEEQIKAIEAARALIL